MITRTINIIKSELFSLPLSLPASMTFFPNVLHTNFHPTVSSDRIFSSSFFNSRFSLRQKKIVANFPSFYMHGILIFNHQESKIEQNINFMKHFFVCSAPLNRLEIRLSLKKSAEHRSHWKDEEEEEREWVQQSNILIKLVFPSSAVHKERGKSSELFVEN